MIDLAFPVDESIDEMPMIQIEVEMALCIRNLMSAIRNIEGSTGEFGQCSVRKALKA
jgi:hypothetical protein